METGASSKNPLQRFAGATTIPCHPPPRVPPAYNPGDVVELSLTLSLGGSFGSSKLARSSSISSFPLFDSSSIEEENEKPRVGPTAQLHRTCSLPVPVPGPGAGDDEDLRKRKEMQGLKRLEAKRKRSEKKNGSMVEDPDSCLLGPGSQAAAPRLLPMLQGSLGLVGSSCSNGGSLLGFDITKLNNSAETKGSALLTQAKDKTCPDMNTPEKIESKSSRMNEMERSVMEDMPCVSTRGLGPNGQRIEGFLYKYRKGEEVRIMCVCHGKFWTPAEFVMHAGGGEVDHPLRHIVVNSSPSPFL